MYQAVLKANEHDLDQLATLFRVLGDKTRIQILLSLADGEKNVSSICDKLGLPQPTVSHHLSLLKMSNIVGCRREGKQVFYGLDGRVSVDGDQGLVLSVQNLNIASRRAVEQTGDGQGPQTITSRGQLRWPG